MSYLLNSGSGFLANAVTTASNVKNYVVNKAGHIVDTIRIGISDFGSRVLDDGGTIEAYDDASASYRDVTKTLYDQASIVLFPSGYKDNLLYSHKPTDGSGDFSYTRGTDTGTVIGEDGYIKKERVNLLEQSNQFDTTWVIVTSVSEGEKGYDGTNDAWSLTRASGGSLMGSQTVSLSGVSTYSIYAKINTNNGIGLAFGGLSIAARFDLRDATKTQAVTETGIISSSQKYVGNGFYRLSITANVSGSTDARIYLTTADASTSDSNGGTHIIQDAQIEQGLVATDYIETTTAPVYAGITDNIPRLDYSTGAACLLLEPSRTNSVEQSEYFGSGWNLYNTTVTQNDTISPEGVQNAAKVVANLGTNEKYVSEFGLNTTINQQNVVSAFVKDSGLTYASLRFTGSDGAFSAGSAWFNLSTGAKGSANASIEDYDIEDYGNGWYRIWATSEAIATSSNAGVRVQLTDTDGGVLAFTGDGTSGTYVWGVQYEQGSYPTSYIPTYGSTQTRAADLASHTGTILTDDDFTLFIHSKATAIPSSGSSEQFFNGIGYLNIDNSGNLRFRYNSTNYSTPEIDVEQEFKFLIRKDSTDMKIYINGELRHTITVLPTGLNNISLEGGLTRKFMTYTTALDTAVCESLTAL